MYRYIYIHIYKLKAKSKMCWSKYYMCKYVNIWMFVVDKELKTH